MKSKKILSIMATAMMLTAPQHAYAQFWKQLGKAAESVGKAALKSATSQSTNDQSQTTKSVGKNSPRYKIHRTADTKTITLRNGVAFMGMFSEGYAVVCQNNGNKTWFVINEKGEKVFDFPEGYYPSSFDVISSSESYYDKIRFNSGRLLIEKVSTRYIKDASIIDTNGKIIKTFNDVSSVSQFTDGVAIIAFSNGNPWFVDVDGNIITKSISLYKDYGSYRIGNLSEGLRSFRDKTTGKYGYLGEKCNMAISPKFKNCQDFSDGLAAVQNDESLWGFIDKTGKYVLEPIYSKKPTSFCCGYAKVEEKSGQTHFIDKTGKIVWTPNDRDGWGHGFLKNGYLVKGDLNGVILNTSFKELAKFSADTGKKTFSDEYFVISDYETYIFDYNGNLLLKCKSDRGSFHNGIGSYNGGQYYFNIKGEIIVEFKDTQF